MIRIHIPFSFVRKKVTGDDFIGREEKLGILESQTLDGKSTYIVGLPRMGRSSLIQQCFFEENNYTKWIEERHLVPIKICVPEAGNPATLWGELSSSVLEFLDEREMTLDYLEKYHEKKTGEERFENLKRALIHISKKLGDRFVFIFDEFDGVLRIEDEENIFRKIRSLSEYGVIVTCSRRLPTFIEKTKTGRCYYTNDSDPVFVGLFNEAEVKEYWKRYAHYFNDYSPAQFKAYQALVKKYGGNHPMLMSLINYTVFKYSDNPLEVWNPERPTPAREEVERTIRYAVNQEFEWQIHYVEEQGMLRTAIQMIVGTSNSIPPEESALLLDYNFAHIVPSSEKHDVFGYNLGPTVPKDISKRYMCFSALTSHLMKERFDPDIKGFDLLREVEVKLREVITEVLRDVCDGDDPFSTENVKITPKSATEERELWERILYNSIPYFAKNASASEAFLNNLREMRKIKTERDSYNCNPNFDRRQINMVTSTTLGQLWYVFIKWQWQEFYEYIFMHCQNKDEWRDGVFQPLLDWRNAADHHNDEELPDDFVEYASQCAREIITDIKGWMGRRNGN